MRPLRAQDADGVALRLDFVLQLGYLLGAIDRLVFDRVGVDRGADQRCDCKDVEEADHRRPLLVGFGNEASFCIAASGAGASADVRMPKRNLAERARGLAAVSVKSGKIG